jgi:hypothetical protein
MGHCTEVGRASEEIRVWCGLGCVRAGGERGQVFSCLPFLRYSAAECACCLACHAWQAFFPLHHGAYQNQRKGERLERLARVHGCDQAAERVSWHIYAQKAHSRVEVHRDGLEGPNQVRSTEFYSDLTSHTTQFPRIGLALRYKILGEERVQVQKIGRRKFWQDMKEQGKLDDVPQPSQPPPPEE